MPPKRNSSNSSNNSGPSCSSLLSPLSVGGGNGAAQGPRTTLAPGVPSLPGGGGGVFKAAAAAVLRAEGRLLSTGEITR